MESNNRHIPYNQIHIDILTSMRDIYKRNEDVNDDIKIGTRDVIKAWHRKIPAQYISKAALNKAAELGIDITKLTWDSQPKYDNHRKIFHFEHVVPVTLMTEMVLNTDEDIESILNQYAICLILKEEDKKLTAAKFRSKRPGGWQECYRSCGIEFIEIN